MGPSDKEDSNTGLQVKDSTSIVKRLRTAVTAPVSSKAFHRLQTVSASAHHSLLGCFPRQNWAQRVQTCWRRWAFWTVSFHLSEWDKLHTENALKPQKLSNTWKKMVLPGSLALKITLMEENTFSFNLCIEKLFFSWVHKQQTHCCPFLPLHAQANRW